MVNRARKYEEDGNDYSWALKQEAKLMKFRLKGKWAWRTYFPVDTMEGLPNNAVVLEEDDKGQLVASKSFDPKNKRHFVKFPPYRASPETKRLTFSQQRKLINDYADSEGSDSGTPNTHEGGSE